MSEDQKLKPGQKFPTPTPGNGDRVFYETLLAQRPTSEMAQEWCVAYGVMEEKDAQKAFKAMVKRKGTGKAASRTPPPSNSTGGKKKKKGKRVLADVEFDAGMDAGGDEGIGVAAL
mmetsp:Transcript_11708/g.21650  ORF Transcript_11708/g.21650 Transcript_11708/m.21650 type:complete len:116 (-) Transcript_11708:276-623(-)|eukprot:CAMPEP_0201868904 /NCGR_PEP_ID=MMETSP0902-20130614/2612_1 /ASSEMBLY_ACC=CAM_ASM_000551 /TAXON_ID=420261 /ORGANISM="Thalassiosira antarctica, Strain CCMP982" /LENGTH=115 /DNA_ID=CAMNT_0048394305 /DNA_START=142 /DNA_END=492 /DNA_ORIENTATION=+